MIKRIISVSIVAVFLVALTLAAFADTPRATERPKPVGMWYEPRSCLQVVDTYIKQCQHALYLLAMRHLNDEQYDLAIARFTQILTFEKFGLVYANRAVAYASKHDYKHAREDAVAALDMTPSSAESWYNLARIDFILKRYEDALDSANVAITLKDDSADFFDLRAHIYAARKRQKLAESDTKRAGELREVEEKKILSERASAPQ